MENLDGGSLDSLLKAGPLCEHDALKYTHHIAEALAYIHDKNILHLDVKPANVLLRQNGESVLIDFGISKRYDDEGGQTSTTPVGISKGYAPVEQYNQGLTNFSPATDIYSLGATLYKMLTGQTPPEASLLLDDEVELIRPANVSFATWVAVEKAMEPRRKRRPQSIGEFLQLLGEQPASQPEPAPLKTSKAPSSINEETQVIDAISEPQEELVEESDCNKMEFDVKGVKFNMIKVEGGTFEMKEIVECGFMNLSSKEIIQKTALSKYWIGEMPVTQELWKAVMDCNPSKFEGDELPVEYVTWDDCQRFISKLNSLTNAIFRLPTEAEWEFAANGGVRSNHFKFSGGDNLNDVAWYAKNAYGKTHAVGQKKPNELGFFDMCGNVWEWCGDYKDNYLEHPQKDPTGPKEGITRVMRGGCWASEDDICQPCVRAGGRENYCSFMLGLRLALTMSK